MLWSLVMACIGPVTDSSSVPDTADTAETASVWEPHPGGVVEVIAEDGAVLVGDFYPALQADQPSMLLYGDFWETRETVSESFVQSCVALGWNVLVMDWRGLGDSSNVDDPYYANRLMDVESTLQFIMEASGNSKPAAVMGGAAMCDIGLFHAYKAETLKDRTQIPAYGMLPFVATGSCNMLNPDQMPHVPAIWVIDRSTPAKAYEEAEREEWRFLKDWLDPAGWGRLEDPNYDDSAALKDALIEFYADVFAGEFD